jgi:hypothetical protein
MDECACSIHFFTDALKDDSGRVMPSRATKGFDPIEAALRAHGDSLKPKSVKTGSFFGIDTKVISSHGKTLVCHDDVPRPFFSLAHVLCASQVLVSAWFLFLTLVLVLAVVSGASAMKKLQ